MNNYLVYVRVSADKQTSEDYLSGYDQAYMLGKYAQFRHWNVVGCVADNIESPVINTKASFNNLSRYLERRPDIDVVITAELEHHCWVDSSAIKAILDRKKVKLVTVSICPVDNDKSMDRIQRQHQTYN